MFIESSCDYVILSRIIFYKGLVAPNWRISTLGCLYELAPNIWKTVERKHGTALVVLEVLLKFALRVDGNLFDVTLLLA